MERDDSNGASFEIIDKKAVDQSSSGEKSGTLSSVSSPYSMPSPSSLSTGNLLSNVAPPSSIPDFTLWTSSTSSSSPEEKASPPVNTNNNPVLDASSVNNAPVLLNQFPETKFSAAIPPSKGKPQEALYSRPNQLPPEGEVAGPSSFLGLVKGALSSQVVTKMVEKAKSSVDSIITTLDPQMSEYIYSSGDLEITVASEEEDIVSAVRDAAHTVFGKAWVNGIKLGLAPAKAQAVSFKVGFKSAEERIECSLKQRKTPTVAIENVLLKQGKNWFDVSLLILMDKEKEVTVQTFSQATPVPVEKFLDKEVADIDIENKLSQYLKGVPCWQEEISGISRKEILTLAARVLFKLYKDQVSQFKA